MAATPIYGKNPSKIFSRTSGPITTKLGKLGMQHRELLSIIFCSNDDLWLTLSYFKARFCNLRFSIGKGENSGFSETIASWQMQTTNFKLVYEGK